jgi:hypothetical protein
LAASRAEWKIEVCNRFFSSFTDLNRRPQIKKLGLEFADFYWETASDFALASSG